MPQPWWRQRWRRWDSLHFRPSRGRTPQQRTPQQRTPQQRTPQQRTPPKLPPPQGTPPKLPPLTPSRSAWESPVLSLHPPLSSSPLPPQQLLQEQRPFTHQTTGAAPSPATRPLPPGNPQQHPGTNQQQEQRPPLPPPPFPPPQQQQQEQQKLHTSSGLWGR